MEVIKTLTFIEFIVFSFVTFYTRCLLAVVNVIAVFLLFFCTRERIPLSVSIFEQRYFCSHFLGEIPSAFHVPYVCACFICRSMEIFLSTSLKLIAFNSFGNFCFLFIELCVQYVQCSVISVPCSVWPLSCAKLNSFMNIYFQ